MTLSLKNPCTILLTKEISWKRILNTNSELLQNRTEKQIMPFKTTVNYIGYLMIYCIIWSLVVLICYLVIGCFDWKVVVFNKQLQGVYCILKLLLQLLSFSTNSCKGVYCILKLLLQLCLFLEMITPKLPTSSKLTIKTLEQGVKYVQSFLLLTLIKF